MFHTPAIASMNQARGLVSQDFPELLAECPRPGPAQHNRGDRAPAWLSSWDGAGIIARIENPAIAEAIRTLSVPMVDVSAAPQLPSGEDEDE